MQLYYSDTFNIKLPPGHRFPGQKYGLLRDCLLARGVVDPDNLHVSPLASIADIHFAHTAPYVEAVLSGTLTADEQRRIGLPWSDALATRALATTGGAIAAVNTALQTGFSGQLAGGTHHAHPSFGSGYCVFNDMAVAALKTIADGRAARVAIIDLDVHQGDGTAAILGDRSDVLILDLYCEKNFPFVKVAPHYGIPLPAGLGDEAYLRILADHLPVVFAFRPDVVLYQAGVDPLLHDVLGHLDLTFNGLAARDRIVFEACRDHGIAVSVALGGGYSTPIEHSVRAYANTFAIAKSVFRL